MAYSPSDSPLKYRLNIMLWPEGTLVTKVLGPTLFAYAGVAGVTKAMTVTPESLQRERRLPKVCWRRGQQLGGEQFEGQFFSYVGEVASMSVTVHNYGTQTTIAKLTCDVPQGVMLEANSQAPPLPQFPPR